MAQKIKVIWGYFRKKILHKWVRPCYKTDIISQNGI
jgi:hypothetical protein